MTSTESGRADMPVLESKPASGSDRLLHAAIRDIAGYSHPQGIKVLDFCCGGGWLVTDLRKLGYRVYGCDLDAYWRANLGDDPEFAVIRQAPFQIPFEDESFDVVLSTSVFEHAQNTEACFREIRRVLKPGGYAIHLVPGKWYLPYEPHIFVPLVNHLWPHVPQWWLALWARLGVRNRFQIGMPWRDVVEMNLTFCKLHLIYLSNTTYRRLSLEIFGSYSSPMDFYIEQRIGGAAKLFSRLPFRRLTGWFLGQVRTSLIIQRKLPVQELGKSAAR